LILLDTHIWLNWLILGEGALPPGIRNAITAADRIGVSSIFRVTPANAGIQPLDLTGFRRAPERRC